MHVAVVFGTRPEAIKCAPVIRELRQRAIQTTVIATGQHRQMLDQMLERFAITPDIDLDAMRPNQDLASLTARLTASLGQALRVASPDWVLIQGDTTSAFCGALTAFYANARVGHIEAGLRTGDLQSPFPEEANRKLVAAIAEAHFCPTTVSQENLVREGVNHTLAPVVGNTVIDSLLWAIEQVETDTQLFKSDRSRRVLVTLHRRENQGKAMEDLARTIRRLADQLDLEVLFPLHKSPTVRQSLLPILERHSAIQLCEPLDYFALIKALCECDLVLTDSGGIQEEAPTLGKPVLVLRDTTERPEGIAAGVTRLVGTDPQRVYTETRQLLEDPVAYAAMATSRNPYGDGKAAARIVDYLTAAGRCSATEILDTEAVA